MERGHIYKGQYSGWYSVPDESFLSDPQVSRYFDLDTMKMMDEMMMMMMMQYCLQIADGTDANGRPCKVE